MAVATKNKTRAGPLMEVFTINSCGYADVDSCAPISSSSQTKTLTEIVSSLSGATRSYFSLILLMR